MPNANDIEDLTQDSIPEHLVPITLPDAELETLKQEFRQAILDRAETVRITRSLELLDVTVDTPEILLREMNELGFSRHCWRQMPLQRFPEIDQGLVGFVRRPPSVFARLDFAAASLDLRHIYAIDKNVQNYLRLDPVQIEWIGQNKTRIFQAAQQFHFDVNENIIGVSILTKLDRRNRRSKTYGHLYDKFYFRHWN